MRAARYGGADRQHRPQVWHSTCQLVLKRNPRSVRPRPKAAPLEHFLEQMSGNRPLWLRGVEEHCWAPEESYPIEWRECDAGDRFSPERGCGSSRLHPGLSFFRAKFFFFFYQYIYIYKLLQCHSI